VTDAAGSPAEAITHLHGSDPVLAAIMERVGPEGVAPRRERPNEHYGALVRTITGQQLSVKAASSIYGRLEGFFGGHCPGPEELLAADPEEMRAAAGLSRAKVKYLRSLAEHVIDGDLELERLDDLPEEQVIEELTAIKGLGEWSAHMFLMFHLGRPDVMPVGDLGVRNGMRIAYSLDETPTPKRAMEIGAAWAPFRSVGSWYMWRASEPNAPDI